MAVEAKNLLDSLIKKRADILEKIIDSGLSSYENKIDADGIMRIDIINEDQQEYLSEPVLQELAKRYSDAGWSIECIHSAHSCPSIYLTPR